jgi:serine phosphatase RsbU (regulator of sigma subunit)/CheY-like chemotaxis protein
MKPERSDKILLIEDEPIFAQAVSMQLVSIGYEEHSIFSTDALAELAEIRKVHEPELILLDLNITDSSGIETFDKVNERFPLSAIIVLSGMDDEELALLSVKKGAQDYILKTELNPTVLGKSMQYGLERKRLISELFLRNEQLKNLNDEILNVNASLEEKVVERTEEIERQKRVITEKNKEIIDSINYAKRIQLSLITPEEVLRQTVPNSFVYYNPKDIVSGDFYWFTEIDSQDAQGRDEHLMFFCVADCTGHGVPGAFMSLIGMKILNETVKQRDVNSPSEAMTYLNAQMFDSLNKHSKEDSLVVDGMDAVIFTINYVTRELQFAGANNPLYIVRNEQIIKLKADRKAIGAQAQHDAFENHHFQLEPGDTIYAFTDGFADQFGGPDGKKLKLIHFNEILLNASKLPIHHQKDHLWKVFNEWKGNNEQVDDVCVMGLRIE